jgi:hypothetical protein
MKATFKASVLINRKNYTVKAYGSRTQRLMSFSPDKILKKTCINFVRKLATLILVEKMPHKASKIHFKSKTNSNFKSVAMHIYKTDAPFIYTDGDGKFNYNAIPIATTLSGCKIISVLRQAGYSDLKPLKIENYKICKGNIAEVKNSNMADWDVLSEKIKPIVNKVINETREYGKASANYYGYTVIGKANISGKSVHAYVLKGIRLEAIIK